MIRAFVGNLRAHASTLPRWCAPAAFAVLACLAYAASAQAQTKTVSEISASGAKLTIAGHTSHGTTPHPAG